MFALRIAGSDEHSPRSRVRAALTASAAVIGTVVATVLVAIPAQAALGDPTIPGPAQAITEPTVSADALPTVQTNGTVWAQVVVGNTVYVTGDFTSARPAGSPAGQNEVTRNGLLAYDITTGVLSTTWRPQINGSGLAIAASPDGKTIYVGGSFTAAGGTGAGTTTRARFAAFDATTGALNANLKPAINNSVRTITATATTVYFGGNFDQIGGLSKVRVAAIDATSGALLPFSVAANPAQVQAVALTPDGSKLVIAGRFQYLNGLWNPGIGWVNATTGAVVAFPANTLVQDYGYSAGILSLSVTATTIIGTGFGYLTVNDGSVANVEGSFGVDVSTGQLSWVEDCHGDTYSTYASNDGFYYLAGHPHTCTNAAGFPEVTPRVSKYALAFTTNARHLTTKNAEANYHEWEGEPSPAIGNWFPTFTTGTWTGQNQAGWSVAGNGDYITYGGEFPTVNGVAQAGLVRFAKRSIAPNKVGPAVSGSAIKPSAVSRAAGTVQLSWPVNYDIDNATLTYQVMRNGTPVATLTHTAAYWDRSRLSWSDSGLASNQSYTYAIVVSDPSGNSVTSPSVSVTTARSTVPALTTYPATVLADGPANYWRLGDTSSTINNWAGGYNAATATGVTYGTAGPIVGDPNTAITFAGTSSSYVRAGTSEPATDTVSIEAWFKTTTTSGGRILGLGDKSTGSSATYDRQIWMANDGTISFGVYPQTTKVVTSPQAYNDGKWHYAAATLGATGMRLYMDGALVAANGDVITGQPPYAGYWRIGGDNLGGWSPAPSSFYFAGSIDEVATYNKVLTPDQVSLHYGIGTTGQAPNQPPTAAFVATTHLMTVSVDGSSSTDADGTVASYAWDFGDGTTGTGVTAVHTYVNPGTYTVTLTVTDNKGAVSAPVTNQVTVITGIPTASFTSTTHQLTASFDGSGSSDADGTITSYAWDFGDGTTGTGATPSHTYAAAGTYNVTLTVTDNDGLTGSVTKAVQIVLVPPTASFVTTTQQLQVSVDGSGSSDSDGTIASYAWTFGDGGTATGVTAAHTYAAGGTYTIQLTVTDDTGLTGTASHDVTVSPAPTVLGSDTFSRTVTSGWGTADVGGPWTTTAGVTSVSNGGGRMSLAANGSAAGARLPGASGTTTVTTVSLAFDKRANGLGAYALVRGRIASTGDEYRVKLHVDANGVLDARLVKSISGSEALIGSVVSNLGTVAAGQKIWTTFVVSGSSPTTLEAKIWLDGQAAPTAWTLSATDTAATLQGSGHIGLFAQLSSTTTNGPIVATFDDLTVTDGLG